MSQPVTFEPGVHYVLQGVGYQVVQLLDDGMLVARNLATNAHVAHRLTQLWQQWQENTLHFARSGPNLQVSAETSLKTTYAFADLSDLPPALQAITWHRYQLLRPLLHVPSRQRTKQVGVYEKVVGKQRKREYPHLESKNINREELLRMETNESLKIALVQQAEEEIEKMIEHLQTLKEGDLKELEQVILRSSLSIGKAMVEQVLTHAHDEHKEPARRQGSCGHRQRFVANRPKQVLTMFGKITIERQYYQCVSPSLEKHLGTCTHGEAPFDEQWGLSSGRTSPGVQKLISFLAASMTLSEATQVFTSLLPLDLSERQALNLLQPVGEALQCQEDKQMQQLFEQARTKHTQSQESRSGKPEPIRRLYIELDGVLARLRRGCVPMEEHERKREGDVYREVKVGAVFEASRGCERSHLVPQVFLDEPGPITYVARRTSAEAFGPLLYQLAHRCGLEQAEQVVVLGDGAAWIRRVVAEQFPRAIHIVDLYHAREHVWKVANAVYGRGTPQATSWAHSVCDCLCEGQIEEVVQRIEELPPIAPEPGSTRSIPHIEAEYFRTNAERMRYPVFRAQGMHIGSGIAEAACKTVVSTRAKRSGMRWTPAGLDAVLALRTAVLNQSYEDFWQSRRHRCA